MSRRWTAAVVTACLFALGTGAAHAKEIQEERASNESPVKKAMRQVSVSAGGGIEGFTGDLSNNLQVGPTWGAALNVQPTKMLGVELGYSGATHEFDTQTKLAGGSGSGADVVRNGAHIAGSVALTPTAVQPYVLAGIGINRYDVRNPVAGFSDSNNGYVPLAGGLKYEKGRFTADARFAVNVQFANDLAVNADTGDQIQGTFYAGTLRLGTRF